MWRMGWIGRKFLPSRTSRMKASEIRELLKLLAQPDILSFAGGIPDPALFPADAFRDAFANALHSGNRGSCPCNIRSAKDMGRCVNGLQRKWASLGVPCEADNILITSGSQQALDYLGKLFLSPDDTALINWPTYLGALGAFNAYEPNYDRLVANTQPVR